MDDDDDEQIREDVLDAHALLRERSRIDNERSGRERDPHDRYSMYSQLGYNTYYSGHSAICSQWIERISKQS